MQFCNARYRKCNGTRPKEMETLSQGFSTPSWRQTGKYMASADHVIFNPEKLGVIIHHFIRGEESRREFKDLSAVETFSPTYQLQPWSSQQQHHHIYFKRLKDIYYTQIFWVLKITWSADARVFSRPPSSRRRKALGTRLRKGYSTIHMGKISRQCSSHNLKIKL